MSAKPTPNQAVLERLRNQIRKLEAQPRMLLMALRVGVPGLDDLGVFRLGSGVELSGEEGAGRSTLALSVVAAACRERRLAAWVDGPHELYPPAGVSLGVELERLLIVRPKEKGQLVWSAVQLLRSGAFACVVLDVVHTGVLLSLVDTRKLLDAARAGGSLLVLLTPAAAPAQGVPRLVLRQARQGVRAVETPVPTGPRFEITTSPGQVRFFERSQLAIEPQVPVSSFREIVTAPALHRVVAVSSLQRPRRNFERDGYRAFAPVHGRPGREGPLQLPTTQRAVRGPYAGRNWR